MAKKKYEAGKTKAYRKHSDMHCIILQGFEGGNLTDEEYVKLVKRCYWIDHFTEAEWKTILNDSPKNPAVHRSNINKKVAGWFLAMGRLAVLQPEWFTESFQKAMEEYQDLIGDDLFLMIACQLKPYEKITSDW